MMICTLITQSIDPRGKYGWNGYLAYIQEAS